MFVSGIPVGTDKKNKTVRIPANPRNLICVIVGDSGCGKTTLVSNIAGSVVAGGDTVVIIDGSGSYTDSEIHPCLRQKYFKYLRRVDIKKEGIPLPIWPYHAPDSGDYREEDVDVVLDILTQTVTLGPIQKMQLRRCLEHAYDHRIYMEDHMRQIDFSIENCLMEKEAAPIINKLHYLLKRVRVNPTLGLWKGAVNILDVNEYSVNAQPQVMDLILAILWQNCQTIDPKENGRLYIALDELHRVNFSTKGATPLSSIIREGRKYGVGLILSTQTLQTFTKQQNALLNQAATKLFGVHATEEALFVAKLVGNSDRQVKDLAVRLKTLRRGEFLMAGDKFIEMDCENTPIIITNNITSSMPVWQERIK